MAKAKREDFEPRFLSAIAHRGLHGNGVSENSLEAFRLAIENNIAFECDVHVSKDEKLIVCHDADLERVTGKKGYIPDLTSEQIRSDYRLKDGQVVPTIEEVLALNQERVPHVVEMKVDGGNSKLVASLTLKALEGVKNKKMFTIICFHPLALMKAKKGGFTRGLLVCLEHPFWLRTLALFDYLDIDIRLLPNKKVEKYRRKGGLVNVWTVEKDEHLEFLKGKADMITFQHLPIDEVKKTIL